MLVSIIIPIYNVAPYVEQCLDSVAAQTYEGDIECLLIDDCGTDDSITRCEHFIEQYEGPIRFRIIRHEHNRGVSAARNTGVVNSKGDWIFFIDSDDWIYNHCISSLMLLAQKYPKAEIVQGAFCAEDEEYNKWLHSGYDVPSDTDYLDDPGLCRLYLQKIGCLAMVHNRLIKKSFIVSNHLYTKEGIRHEDNLWTFMAGKHIHSMAFCKTDTYYYRANHDGFMSSARKEIHAKGLSVICDEIFNNITIGRWYNLELNYLLWRIQSIEKYGYDDPFVFMHFANNRIVQTLYESDRNAVITYTRYSKKYSCKRGIYKLLLYLNVFHLRLSGRVLDCFSFNNEEANYENSKYYK